MSLENLKFMEILKNGTELVGRHQVPLPFTKDEINLPNNHSQQRRDLPAWREDCQEIFNSNKIT